MKTTRDVVESLLLGVATTDVGNATEPGGVPDGRWDDLLRQIDGQRLSGLATAAVSLGRLALRPDEATALRESHIRAMTWTLKLERALLRIAAAAEAERIDVVVLKGPALAHCFYPDPSWRAFADIDLLVRGADWRRACRLLEDLGFQRNLPEPRRGFDERFGKAALHTDGQNLLVDLHRTLVLGPFGLWMQPEYLFERTTTFELAGRTLRRLDDTALLLHACMHASLGWSPPLLMPLRDVAQIARLGRIDWDDLRSLATRWRLSVVVQHAFRTARGHGFTLPDEIESFVSHRAPRSERRALAFYITGRRQRGGTEISALWAIPGVRAKVSYVRALLFPEADFLAARSHDGNRPSLLRRWAVPLRWLGRRRR